MPTADYLQGLFGFDGQVAVVVGGAGELGGAIARGLAQAGAHVVIADVRGDLKPGELMLYSAGGASIVLKNDGSVLINGKAVE